MVYTGMDTRFDTRTYTHRDTVGPTLPGIQTNWTLFFTPGTNGPRGAVIRHASTRPRRALRLQRLPPHGSARRL